MYFSHADILNLDRRYRVALINGLAGFRSVVLVGTANQAGQTNLALFNSALHIGANPPLMGVLLRPEAANQHTRANILSQRVFTLNAVPSAHVGRAHQASSKYPAEVSEFDACSFTPVYFDDFAAPAVAESPVRIGLAVEETVDLSINGTTLVIGSVQHVDVADDVLQADGHLRPDLADLICCAGLDTYFRPAFLCRETS